ncbi:multidrug resistance-associated protein 1, partial [Aphanomyces euteiches]
DADIFLLDAPLAAVDAIVANEIFNKCILGLLRHKTRVLITHNPDIIASKFADSVLKLVEGQFSHVRNVDKQTLGPPPVSPLLGLTGRPRQRKKVANSKGDVTPEAKPAFAAISPSHIIQDGFAPLTSRSSSFVRHNSLDGKLVREEERHEGRVSARVFAAYFNAIGGVSVCFFLVFVQFVWQGLMQASDFYLAYWTSEPDAVQSSNVDTNLAYYSALALGSCVLVLVRTMTVSICGLRAARLLFDQMTHSLVRAPMSFFDVNPVGRILNRYSDDVSRLDFQLPFAYGSLLAVAFSVGCTLLTACVMTKYFGLIILPLLAIYVYLGLFYLQPARELQRLQKTTQSPILAHLSESNEGYSVIRAFDQVSRFCNQNAELIDTNNKTVYVAHGGVIVVVIASSLTYMRFLLSPGVIGLAFNYGLAVDQGLKGLIQIWSWLETSMVSPERMQEYIDLPSEAAYELPNEPVEMGWPSNGRIHFEEVSFRYKEGDKACSCRWREYRTLGLKTLRSRLSIITQSPVLFKGTFRNYLDPFSEYADEELWQVLKKVGLDDLVGVGERQMLCMGRALLSESKVVVMDEATAAIDAETDAKLQKVIKTEFKDATVLTIAHRLDTVLDGDRIMVLDAGRIVQFDTPMRLIAKGQGHFFQLAKEGGYLDRVVE